MSNTKETASLILRTSDIFNEDITDSTLGLVINNSVGSIGQNGQLITFKNVNPQLLLGDMYDKFTKFNLNLSCFTTRKTVGNLSDGSDMTYFMSGFNWSNQGYSLKSGSITNQAVFFTHHLTSNAYGGSDVNIKSNSLTFNKPISNFYITF